MSAGGDDLDTVDHKAEVGAEGAGACFVGHVDVKGEGAHAVAAVVEVVELGGSVAGDGILVPAEAKVGANGEMESHS